MHDVYIISDILPVTIDPPLGGSFLLDNRDLNTPRLALKSKSFFNKCLLGLSRGSLSSIILAVTTESSLPVFYTIVLSGDSIARFTICKPVASSAFRVANASPSKVLVFVLQFCWSKHYSR